MTSLPRPSFIPPPPPRVDGPPPLVAASPPPSQSLLSSVKNSKSPNPLDPETELIRTEESYVNDLRILVETFVIPLEKWFARLDLTKANRQSPDFCLETIACEQNINLIDVLFANIKVILQCNQLLLDGLHSAENSAVEGAVVASFVKHAPYLKLYSQYTKNCHRATELLKQLRADIRFSSFITCAELQGQCRGLNLQSFLIMPIQRGPRYELLLKEMKKHAKTTELKDLIQKAIDIIVGVIKNIDSAVVGDEKRDRLLEIQDQFRITLAEPARYVVKCGDLKKVCHTGKRVFYFVLCNDLILYGEEIGLFPKNSKQKYKFHREIYLSDLRIILISSDSKSFIIIGPDKAFEVEASSTEECSTWIESLIELKTTKTLNVHHSAVTETKPIRVIKLWQIDNVVGSIRLAKYSIPEGKDGGVMLMDDLIPLEDEIGFDFRDSLSMSSVGTNSASYDPTSYLKSSFRSRGDSSGLPATGSLRVNSRSKSVTGSSTSSDPPTIDELKSVGLQPSTEQTVDIFAGEMLVPTPGLLDPPSLHSVWSTEFEDTSTQGSHKSIPRAASSPDVRNSAGLLDLLTNERNSVSETSNGASSHSSSNFESAFKGSPKAQSSSAHHSRSMHGGSGGSGNGNGSHVKTLSNTSQQLSFAEEDDLFDFLTSNPTQDSSSQSTQPNKAAGAPPLRQSTKKLVLDQDKFILGRK